MERVKGIEPSSAAWEAAALPLSYTRSGRDSRQELQGQQIDRGPNAAFSSGREHVERPAAAFNVLRDCSQEVQHLGDLRIISSGSSPSRQRVGTLAIAGR